MEIENSLLDVGQPYTVYPLALFDFVVLFKIDDKTYHAFFNNVADACEFTHAPEFDESIATRVMFGVQSRADYICVSPYDENGRVQIDKRFFVKPEQDVNQLLDMMQALEK